MVLEEYPDNVGVSRYRDSRKKETEIGWRDNI